MYYKYFGLAESPFSISVNPRYLFMSPRHRDALAHLLYGVGSGGGFILLTGEVGTGKTTINRALLEQLPANVDLAIVLNPALSAVELLATVCDELEIEYPAGVTSLKHLTDALHRFLLANHAAGRRTVLMIDEAQHLDFDVLEQIRLLTNLETDHEKLLQIILIGQPELTEKLARPELRQLNQRITARYNLEPLTAGETAAYIRHRLEVAGLPAGQELFPAGAVREIHKRAAGIPRQINLLCDRTLLGAYGRSMGKVNRQLVAAAAGEVFGPSATNKKSTLGPAWLWGAIALAVMVGALRWGADGIGGRSVTSEVPVEREDRTRSDASGRESPAWLISEATAQQRLWQLASDSPMPPDPCQIGVRGGLRCSRGISDVWEPLISLNRPVVLAMQTPDRFTAATLVVAFQQPDAWIWGQQGLQRISLVEMAEAWRGEYLFLWQPPVAWTGSVALGDNSAAVAVIADMFARLDGQPQPLTENLFTSALADRVTLFQTVHNLEADGVVGEQTMLRLNQALGLSPTPERVLERAQWLSRGP